MKFNTQRQPKTPETLHFSVVSFKCISNLSLFANKSNIQETCSSKTFISRVLSAPNFYCSNFNDRAVPRYLACCSIGVYFFVKGTSVLLFSAFLFPDLLCVKHFVVVGAFVVNKCIFNSFQISVYYHH